MSEIDKDKLSKVNGGISIDLSGKDIEAPGVPSDFSCKEGFDSRVCNGCPFCNVSHNPTNTSIITFKCQKSFYNTVIYDLSKAKIIG